MYKSNDHVQLFCSTRTAMVIELPKLEGGFVAFLFSQVSAEAMKGYGWEAIETSDYLGEKPMQPEECLVSLSQELGLFG